MKYFVITGASKGLGEGIATELIHENHHLICVSRTESARLKLLARAKGCGYTYTSFDLGYAHEVPQLLSTIFEHIPLDNVQGIYLINNAGIVQPVDRVELCSPDQVEHHMNINLLAPMLLCSGFIKHTNDWPVQKRILNISSGAAKNPYWGWSSYCTSKAGIDMLSKCVALEQMANEYPVEIMAVAPGIIDTAMQEVIRNTTETQFPLRSRFVELKEAGNLTDPQIAGKKLAALLLSDRFQSGEIVDLRDSY